MFRKDDDGDDDDANDSEDVVAANKTKREKYTEKKISWKLKI